MSTNSLAEVVIMAVRRGHYPVHGRFYYIVWETPDGRTSAVEEQYRTLDMAMTFADLYQRREAVQGGDRRVVVKTRDTATVVYQGSST